MADITVSKASGRAPSPMRLRLLEAAELCLLRDGYAGLSTRSVAEAAQTPLSQIHYHFGSKQGLVLALLAHQNEKLLVRQADLIGADAPVSARWAQACDVLEEDLRSGYVRVLQEIIAAGYSDPDMAAAARDLLEGWSVLLTQLGADAGAVLGLGGFLTAEEIGALIGMMFLGAESMILIDIDSPIRSALRGVGHAVAKLEAAAGEASGAR
jgi:AcrR family transcriptional regulator